MGRLYLAGKAGLVEGLTGRPHHLRKVHSLLTPALTYTSVAKRLQNGRQAHLGQMSAPPHFGFGFGPPDPGAFDPRKVAQYHMYMKYRPTYQSRWKMSCLAQVVFWEQCRPLLCGPPAIVIWGCLNDPYYVKRSSPILNDSQRSRNKSNAPTSFGLVL